MTLFNHIGQVVTDLERTKRFYKEVLGFKPWFEFQPPDDLAAKLNEMKPGIGTTASYLVLDAFVIELIHYATKGVTEKPRRRTMGEPGLTHISVAVDDIPATCKKVLEHGGEVIQASDIGLGIMIRDPDGQLIELLKADYRAGLPPKP